MKVWQDPPGFVRPTEPRQEAAAGLRAYVPWLRNEGLLEPLRARCSPKTAALLARPPLPTAWLDEATINEIYDGVEALRGLDGARAMGLYASRSALGMLLRPMLGMYLKLSGSTPASVFSHLPAMAALFIRGIAFSWTPRGPTQGELVIAYANRAPPALFQVWMGILEFAFEMCKTTGKFELELDPRGTAGRLHASWSLELADAPSSGDVSFSDDPGRR